MINIPSIIIPIIENNEFTNKNLINEIINKKIILFGVPGAFTPTCSEQHFPGFLNSYELFIDKGIDDIYCLSVNDKYVMQSWILSYPDGNKIKGIADGNADLTKILSLSSDKSENHMGVRCKRFAMIIQNTKITKTYIEEKGGLENTSAEFIYKIL